MELWPILVRGLFERASSARRCWYASFLVRFVEGLAPDLDLSSFEPVEPVIFSNPALSPVPIF